jgi:hypothetical protein
MIVNGRQFSRVQRFEVEKVIKNKPGNELDGTHQSQYRRNLVRREDKEEELAFH